MMQKNRENTHYEYLATFFHALVQREIVHMFFYTLEKSLKDSITLMGNLTWILWT